MEKPISKNSYADSFAYMQNDYHCSSIRPLDYFVIQLALTKSFPHSGTGQTNSFNYSMTNLFSSKF